MANVDDVAAAVLEIEGPVDTFKLQKLVYYCQAWHLVWEGVPLFQARIEAWANGPVVPKLYAQHRTQYRVRDWPSGESSRLKDNELESITIVCRSYGDETGQALAEMSHREDPWKDARRSAGLRTGD